jgi:hypothetical protein
MHADNATAKSTAANAGGLSLRRDRITCFSLTEIAIPSYQFHSIDWKPLI